MDLIITYYVKKQKRYISWRKGNNKQIGSAMIVYNKYFLNKMGRYNKSVGTVVEADDEGE
jgi:hypothetical protein